MFFKQPNKEEFEQIKQLVEELWLDNENMQPEQFYVLPGKGKVMAFGRLREYPGGTEICSIGVAKDFQGKGLGKKMIEHLLQHAKGDVYLVTVIPGFFAKMGFGKVSSYPDFLKHKVELCVEAYHVDSPYFVMKWNNSHGDSRNTKKHGEYNKSL